VNNGVVSKIYLKGNTLMVTAPKKDRTDLELVATGNKHEFAFYNAPELGGAVLKFDISKNKATAVTYIKGDEKVEFKRKE
jgi:hypothetical protein